MKILKSFFSLISLNSKMRTFSLSLDLIIVIGYILTPNLAVTYVVLRNLEIMFVSLFDQLIFKIVARREDRQLKNLLKILPFFSLLLLFISLLLSNSSNSLSLYLPRRFCSRFTSKSDAVINNMNIWG